MRRIATFALIAALALVASAAFAVLPQERLADPALEARARALSQQLRCQVCQNQSIDESNAPLAADLRRIVRERLAQGESDRDVLAYLSQRYGDYVLLRPPVGPATWALWFGPALILGAGALGVWTYFRRRRVGAPGPAALAPEPLAPEEEARLAHLLDPSKNP